MKGFITSCRAATCASGVILESCSPESVVAKRRDSVQKPYGMTSAWGARTANTVRIARAGFTLIELLVVVLIIGILAAMALPDYQRAVEVSRVGAALSFSRAFRDSVDRYYMAHNRFPASPDVLDIGLTECPKYFRCIYGYLAAEGKLEMWRQNGPFEYGLFTRSTVSPYQPGSIYCIASRKKTQGIEFCQHWGEADASPSEPNWFSVLVQ